MNKCRFSMMAGLVAGLIHTSSHAADPPQTAVTIRDGRWCLNGQVTYPGAAAEGLLMNVRMVNAVFEDTNRSDFDPEAVTDRLVRRIPDYVGHGIRAITLCLQGGMPGYEGAVNSAFAPDGSLRDSYMQRVHRVIAACDQNGAVVILGCFYQRQDQILQDEAAVRAGVVNAARWVRDTGFKNVVLEVANEFGHSGYDHAVLKSATGQAELIRLAQQAVPGLLVSSSGLGKGTIPTEVAEAADYILIHFNTTKLQDIPTRIAEARKFGKPVVCNEDEKTGADGAKAAAACVTAGASWGLMLRDHNQKFPFAFDGPADDPIVYAEIQRLTSPIR